MALRRVSLNLAAMAPLAAQITPTTSPIVSATPLSSVSSALSQPRQVRLNLAAETSAANMISTASAGDPLGEFEKMFGGGSSTSAQVAADTQGAIPHAAVPTNASEEEGAAPGAVHADVVAAEQVIAFYVHLYTGVAAAPAPSN